MIGREKEIEVRTKVEDDWRRRSVLRVEFDFDLREEMLEASKHGNDGP